MPRRLSHHLVLIFLFLGTQSVVAEDEHRAQLGELDAFWTEVSRSVQEGDFEGYAATCHPQGVLVSEAKQTSYTLVKALAGWKQGFLDTKAGKMKAGVEFQFSQRIGDETTAHETGIFRYVTIDNSGKETAAHIHFAALLVKTNGRWQVLMEHQKTNATEKEWRALKSSRQKFLPSLDGCTDAARGIGVFDLVFQQCQQQGLADLGTDGRRFLLIRRRSSGVTYPTTLFSIANRISSAVLDKFSFSRIRERYVDTVLVLTFIC